MSHINSLIDEQNFELIRDRIGEILSDELNYQADYVKECDVAVWRERDVPFSQGEPPAVNVSLFEGDPELQTLIKQDWDYKFYIDHTRQGKGTDDKLGDERAMVACQRVMGIIRSIMMNPKYITLGFEPGFIKHRRIGKIEFGKPVRQDTSHTVLGRLTFCVKCIETTPLVTPRVAASFLTSVRLGLTDKGYLWANYGGNVFNYVLNFNL